MRSVVLRCLLITMLCALTILVWWEWPDHRLHVFFLETDGDAVLIQTPQGGYVLVDGGADPTTLATQLGRHLPFWRRQLDAVVLTLPDAQRLPGQLAALARYQAGMALAPPALHASADVAEWQRLLRDQGVQVHTARTGERLQLGGVDLAVLAMGDGDTTGLVLRLDYGRTHIVLAGASGAAVDQRVVRSAPFSALAWPWEQPLPTALLDAAKPRALIFTDGTQSKHPALLTTRERAVHGAAVYHEHLNGTIELLSDGAEMVIRIER